MAGAPACVRSLFSTDDIRTYRALLIRKLCLQQNYRGSWCWANSTCPSGPPTFINIRLSIRIASSPHLFSSLFLLLSTFFHLFCLFCLLYRYNKICSIVEFSLLLCPLLNWCNLSTPSISGLGSARLRSYSKRTEDLDIRVSGVSASSSGSSMSQARWDYWFIDWLLTTSLFALLHKTKSMLFQLLLRIFHSSQCAATSACWYVAFFK